MAKADRLDLTDFFAQEEVSILDFVSLNDDDLEEIGIENPEERKHIRRGSKKFVEHIKKKDTQDNIQEHGQKESEPKGKCISVVFVLI